MTYPTTLRKSEHVSDTVDAMTTVLSWLSAAAGDPNDATAGLSARCMLVLGVAGSGKSTLAEIVEHQLWKPRVHPFGKCRERFHVTLLIATERFSG